MRCHPAVRMMVAMDAAFDAQFRSLEAQVKNLAAQAGEMADDDTLNDTARRAAQRLQASALDRASALRQVENEHRYIERICDFIELTDPPLRRTPPRPRTWPRGKWFALSRRRRKSPPIGW